MLTVLLYVIAVVWALGIITSITSVGKPRTPITGGVAAFSAVLGGLFIAVLIVAANRLAGWS